MEQRTIPRIEARKEQLRRMSKEERHKLGLRLFAIYSGQQSAKAYKARGLDSFVHARAAKAKKRAMQMQQNTEDTPRSKQLPIG